MSISSEYFDIGNDIIGAAYEVRNNAGKGMRETFYEHALAYELKQRGRDVQSSASIRRV